MPRRSQLQLVAVDVPGDGVRGVCKIIHAGWPPLFEAHMTAVAGTSTATNCIRVHTYVCLRHSATMATIHAASIAPSLRLFIGATGRFNPAT